MNLPIDFESYGLHFDTEAVQITTDTVLTTTDALYKQFSEQNLRLCEATLRNNEHKKFMPLEINNRSMNINTVDIQGDGNCLFSTIVHQLKGVKIDSDTHKTQTAELRTQPIFH